MLSLQPALPVALLAPALCCAAAWFYSVARPWPVAAEIFACLGTITAIVPIGVALSYGAVALGMPLQDRALSTIDAALGFDWLTWARFVGAHPWLDAAQRFAYDSHFWQPLVTIPIIALWGPPGRNREMMIALIVALAVTITISALVPALGPAQAHGFETREAQIVIDLRQGQPGPYPYSGIIWCPSYHTVMAILFTLAHRDMPTFWLALPLNLLMLSGIPNVGNHYLADVVAGCAVASAAFAVSRLAEIQRLPRRQQAYADAAGSGR